MLEKNTTKVLNSEPQLAPPGAGVPWSQKLMMRFFIKPFVAGRTSWEDSEKRFRKINEKIFSAIEGLNESQLETKILVPPQVGLEDSSRYWSIKLVLEHMIIVASQMYALIPALTKSHAPEGKADIGQMKPKDQMGVFDTVGQFKKLTTTDFDKMMISIQDRKSKTRFDHPWFGMMTAQQWYWLLASHHALHLKQIREIKKRLV